MQKRREAFPATSARERGAALLLTMVFSVGLFVLSGALVMIAMTGNEAADKVVEYMKALNNAETGIAMGITELNARVDISGDGAIGSASEQFTNPSGSVVLGDYTVTVQVQDLDNRRYMLESTGTVRSMGHIYTRTIQVVVSPPVISPFEFAAFGDKSVHMDSNAITDSYDSEVGDYASQIAARYKGQDYANADGSVGANGPSITLDSNATVMGNATPGPGGSVTTASNSHVEGATDPGATDASPTE